MPKAVQSYSGDSNDWWWGTDNGDWGEEWWESNDKSWKKNDNKKKKEGSGNVNGNVKETQNQIQKSKKGQEKKKKDQEKKDTKDQKDDKESDQKGSEEQKTEPEKSNKNKNKNKKKTNPESSDTKPVEIKESQTSDTTKASNEKPKSKATTTPASSTFQSRTTSTTKSFLTQTRFKDLLTVNVRTEVREIKGSDDNTNTNSDDTVDIITNVTKSKLQNFECHCPYSLRAITESMGYENLTRVQLETIPYTFNGSDVFAKAKTGTGKTLGFLLPVVEKSYRWKKEKSSLNLNNNSGSNKNVENSDNTPFIGSLILSPTRELSSQTYEECLALTKFWGQKDDNKTNSKNAKSEHWTNKNSKYSKLKEGYKNSNDQLNVLQESENNFNVALLYGGVDIKKDIKQLNGIFNNSSGKTTSNSLDCLIATPGRLIDHLVKKNTEITINKINSYNFRKLMSSCPYSFTFVLDEADQLLEMGFRDAICEIERYLPSRDHGVGGNMDAVNSGVTVSGQQSNSTTDGKFKGKNKKGKGKKEDTNAKTSDESDDKIVSDSPPRQTLLFSATVTEQIRKISTLVLRQDYKFVDCIGDNEPVLQGVSKKANGKASSQSATDTNANSAVNEQVQQKLIIVQDHTQLLLRLFGYVLKDMIHLNKDSNGVFMRPKIIVFLPTAKQTQVCAEIARIFFAKESVEIFEIHSRKSQAARTKASDRFRDFADNVVAEVTEKDTTTVATETTVTTTSKKGKGKKSKNNANTNSISTNSTTDTISNSKTTQNSHAALLFTSDVSARGLDYPNVSHVIQVGAPSSREQYLHRLGRTARAGCNGYGVLMIGGFETFVLRGGGGGSGGYGLGEFFDETKGGNNSNAKGGKNNQNSSNPKFHNLNDTTLDLNSGPQNLNKKTIIQPFNTALSKVDDKTKSQAYAAWLGYYNSLISPKKIKWSKEELVSNAYEYARQVLGVEEENCPPEITKKSVAMMGLKGVKGLRVEGLKYNEAQSTNKGKNVTVTAKENNNKDKTKDNEDNLKENTNSKSKGNTKGNNTKGKNSNKKNNPNNKDVKSTTASNDNEEKEYDEYSSAAIVALKSKSYETVVSETNQNQTHDDEEVTVEEGGSAAAGKQNNSNRSGNKGRKPGNYNKSKGRGKGGAK